MAVSAQGCVCVDEVSTSVVVVEVDPGEIADHEQIEVCITIEIDEAARIGAAKAFFGETGGFGEEFESTVAIVSEQVRGPAVVGVEEGGGHLSV